MLKSPLSTNNGPEAQGALLAMQTSPEWPWSAPLSEEGKVLKKSCMVRWLWSVRKNSAPEIAQCVNQTRAEVCMYRRSSTMWLSPTRGSGSPWGSWTMAPAGSGLSVRGMLTTKRLSTSYEEWRIWGICS